MTRFKKILLKIRAIQDGDDNTDLVKGFAEQLNYVRGNLRFRKKLPGEKKCCGGGDNEWLKQRLEDKLIYYCNMYGLKEIA